MRDVTASSSATSTCMASFQNCLCLLDRFTDCRCERLGVTLKLLPRRPHPAQDRQQFVVIPFLCEPLSFLEQFAHPGDRHIAGRSSEPVSNLRYGLKVRGFNRLL